MSMTPDVQILQCNDFCASTIKKVDAKVHETGTAFMSRYRMRKLGLGLGGKACLCCIQMYSLELEASCVHS